LTFLYAEGSLSTRELAHKVLVSSGMDTMDKVLSKAVAHKVVYIARAQERPGTIKRSGFQKNACVWSH
jgi:hypothetical protein